MALARIRPGDLVVDIGAGTGAITRALLDVGARVHAVELHPGRAARLRHRCGNGDVRVVVGDARFVALPRSPFHVVANPPFAVLAELMRRLTARHSGMGEAHLIVPAHLAARWSRGAVTHASRYDAQTLRHLPLTAFSPAATQPTAVLRLSRRAR